MQIRPATDQEWAAIYRFFSAIVAAGETYAYPDDLTSEEAGRLWLQLPPTTRPLRVG